MSKYGFDEKEIRKTIITEIDKDGFHKETVIYGDTEAALEKPFSANFINSEAGDLIILVNNVPSGSFVNFTQSADDRDYELDIGATVSMDEYGTVTVPGISVYDFINKQFEKVRTAFNYTESKYASNSRGLYYRFYAIDHDSLKATARAKLFVPVIEQTEQPK